MKLKKGTTDLSQMNSGRQRGRLWVMRNELDVLYAATLERNELMLYSYLRTVK